MPPNVKDKQMVRWIYNFKSEGSIVASRVIFLISCQLSLVFFLAYEQLKEDKFFEAYKETPSSWYLVICRFLCGCFLHITLVTEIKQAFKMMRYSLNHPWKFQSWITAYMIGLS